MFLLVLVVLLLQGIAVQEKIHRNVPRHVLVVIQKRSRTIKKVRDLYLLFLSYNFFSHPDYTVGFGISPNQLLSQVADYTAGGESHPAPKNDIHLFVNRISHFASYCNIFYS